MLLDFIMSCSIGRGQVICANHLGANQAQPAKKRGKHPAGVGSRASCPAGGLSKARQGEGCCWLGLAFLHKALGTTDPAATALEERGGAANVGEMKRPSF